MQCKLIGKNFISVHVGINAASAENLFDQFSRPISHMTEFGLLIMSTTSVVPRPYKNINKMTICIFQKYKDMIKVVCYF